MRCLLLVKIDGALLVRGSNLAGTDYPVFCDRSIAELAAISATGLAEVHLLTSDECPADAGPVRAAGDILQTQGVAVTGLVPARSPDGSAPSSTMQRVTEAASADSSAILMACGSADDVALAGAIRATAIRVDEGYQTWADVREAARKATRRSIVVRETRETSVLVEIAVDGRGETDIRTGLGFFDHMLDQLGKHAGVDLMVHVDGDLHVDEHHTIEDTALALGRAFREALGDKSGIGRYAFVLPMDDARTDAALDFGGRAWLVFEAEFEREIVGDMPTEMVSHFFRSLCDAAACTLHLRIKGENEHHMIESAFKAVGRCLREACRVVDPGGAIPSTKGVL